MKRILQLVDFPYEAFPTREDAGRALAEEVSGEKIEQPFVMAVPRGGVPVGREIARALSAPLDVIVLRKLPIPFNTEAGFGAVSLDGTVVFNEPLKARLRLPEEKVKGIVREVLEEVRRRNRAYRGERPFPELRGRSVILVDDGIASGFSMVAAVEMVRKREPARVIVAVPVAPLDSLNTVAEYADDLVCLIGQRYVPFAVASFYGEFPEMTDAEVRAYLEDSADSDG